MGVLDNLGCSECYTLDVYLVEQTMTTKDKARNYRLKRAYGITLLEYEAILKLQRGVCYICKRPPAKTSLHVDHKHQPRDKRLPGSQKRAYVRGLLCWRCNSGLSKYKDDPQRFRRAAQYLSKPPAKKVIT